MNINAINFLNNISSKSNIKNQSSKSQVVNNQQINMTSVMPKADVLRAYNKIAFRGCSNFIAIPYHDINQEIEGVKISIPFSDEQNIALVLEADDGIDILFKENNSINSDAMEFFVSVYKQIYTKKTNSIKSDIELLEKIIKQNKTNNIYSIDPNADAKNALLNSCMFSGREWVEKFLNSINDREQRDEMANMYLDLANENLSDCVLTSAQLALGVVALSKTKNGFDDGEIDKKCQILENVYSLGGDRQLVLQEFLNAYTDENGNIDLNSMLESAVKLANIMTNAVESTIDWLE